MTVFLLTTWKFSKTSNLKCEGFANFLPKTCYFFQDNHSAYTVGEKTLNHCKTWMVSLSVYQQINKKHQKIGLVRLPNFCNYAIQTSKLSRLALDPYRIRVMRSPLFCNQTDVKNKKKKANLLANLEHVEFCRTSWAINCHWLPSLNVKIWNWTQPQRTRKKLTN